NDHLGTPVAMTDSTQDVVWSVDKTPFGETQASGVIKEDSRFPGQIYDEETAYYYNYFRVYDPTLGRYIQSDPVGLLGGLNTYAYVSANPLLFSDPLGLAQYQGLGQIENHLRELGRRQGYDFDSDPGAAPERAMIERLRRGHEDPEDIAFYLHERAEAKACENLQSASDELYMRVQGEAHNRILREQGVDDVFDLYHPIVRQRYREAFTRHARD
ncbi:MAG: RHS repeat-associated core domain-containing protein, partial [Pseudomonadota bacterium]